MVTVQDFIQEIRTEHKDQAPMIAIIGPTQRCGTTLLQRVINAGDEAIIYGENFLMMEQHPQMLGGIVQNYENKVHITSSLQEAFFQEKRTDVDATALYPNYQRYAHVAYNTLFDLLAYYDRYSKEQGRKIWGIKHQPKLMGGFQNFLQLVPNVKIVFIYRDLVDVAKSHRARWPKKLSTDEQFAAYGKRWATHIEAMKRYEKRSLFIKYEDMVADKMGYADKLEAYLGVKISRTEFDKKVNAHFVKEDLENEGVKDKQLGGKYTAPSAISATQTAALLTYAGDLYKNLGYGK